MKPNITKRTPKTCGVCLAALLAAQTVSAAWLPAIGPGPLRFFSPPLPVIAAPRPLPQEVAAAPSSAPVSAPSTSEPAVETTGAAPEPAVVTRVSSPETSGDPGGPGLSLGDLLLSPLVPSDADLAAPRESLSLLLRQPRLFLPPEVGMTPQISFSPPTNTPQAARSTYLTP